MLRRPRLWIGLAVGLVVLFAVAYFGIGIVVYNTVSPAKAHCSDRPIDLANTPASFKVDDAGVPVTVNLDDYAMPNYQSVSFPSRVDNLTISAWYAPADTDAATAPSVILVHGLSSCKNTAYILFPAGILHKAGFNVLMLDLRDHGDSTIEDGRFAGGTEEYRDVLGGFDWLVNEQHLSATNIGLFGTSLGAATALIATGEEPQVKAVWEDSSYADIQVAIRAELGRYGIPDLFAPAAATVAKLVSGDDLLARSPLWGVQHLNGRPIFITHGTADKRLSVQYATDLANAVNASGGQVEPWIVDGATHVQAMWMHSAEYEQKLVEFFTTSLNG